MSQKALPSHASVVVIGGGIMGCSTLYHLAEMGVSDAILIERNKLTSGTTWHSAAQVRALRDSRNLTRMIQYSVELYSKLEEITGQSVGWIQEGSLSIATTENRVTHVRRQEALAHSFGIQANWVSKGEAKERWPLMNADDVLGAVWSPEDGRVSPSDVCAALVKGAKASGASLFENTGVTGILTEQGRITGVETTQGTVKCDAIALCTGLWSREVGAMAGARVPALACEHFYMVTKPVEGIVGNLPTLSDHDNHLYIRDDSGGLLVGCFEPMGKPIAPGVLDETFEFGLLPEDWDHFEPMMEKALERLPALEHAEVKMLLNGPESFTPDGNFMLGETAETRGLFLGCGMNSIGMASGGGAGMNLAHCIVHGRTAYDLSDLDAKRFAPVFDSVKHLMARAPEILGKHYEIALPGRQLVSARDIRQTPLEAEHRKAGAHMGQFYGWERPLYFGKTAEPELTFGRAEWFNNVANEVRAASETAAVFDSSTFGKIDVTGKDAERFLECVCARTMSKPIGTVIYTAVLNEQGTYESDITAQRIANDHYRLFTGTNAIVRDMVWLQRYSEGFEVVLHDCTTDYAVLALMGPDAVSIVSNLGAPDLRNMKTFTQQECVIAGINVRAARLSYVGEAGWELSCDVGKAVDLYRSLIDAGATPAGLYAQTSMRIEKGFAAMGHELDADVSPIQAGMGYMVKPSTDFVGGAAFAAKRTNDKRTLVTILLDEDDAVRYRVGCPIALGHVSVVNDGSAVTVNIAGRHVPGRMQLMAAIDPKGLRMNF